MSLQGRHKDQIIFTHPLIVVLRRPGGPCEEPKPDPIPNSAVKLLSANGTVSQDPGESVAARPAKHNDNLHNLKTNQTIYAPSSRGGAATLSSVSEDSPTKTGLPRIRRKHNHRGVEQPGSSSGS
jgi:hypothetical protein